MPTLITRVLHRCARSAVATERFGQKIVGHGQHTDLSVQLLHLGVGMLAGGIAPASGNGTSLLQQTPFQVLDLVGMDVVLVGPVLPPSSRPSKRPEPTSP